MSTIYEHLNTVFNPLKIIRPILKDAAFRQDLLKSLKSDGSNPNQRHRNFKLDDIRPHSLSSILEQSHSFPPYTTILGICGDGLPFLLDLTNPAPGSILITGDPNSGKAYLLQSILASISKMNPSKRVKYYLITNYPESFEVPLIKDYCKRVSHFQEQSTVNIIEELAEITDERRRSKPQDPAMILAIDDLAGLCQHLDRQVFTKLYRLIKHGPRSRIWPIASISAQESTIIDPHLLDAFHTRLVGHIKDKRLGKSLTADHRSGAYKLDPGVQFLIPYGDEWIPFWICDPN